MASWRILFMIALCGAAGAVARYALSEWAYRSLGTSFPFGTLVVNLLGCFLLGGLAHVGLATDAVPEAWRVAIGVGFLGGLTTFSTFGYETFRLVEERNWAVVGGNVAAHLLLGFAAIWAGVTAARLLVGGA